MYILGIKTVRLDKSFYVVKLRHRTHIGQTEGRMQGTNTRKVISEVYTFFVLQCSDGCQRVDIESILAKIIYNKHILVIRNYNYVNFQNYQN